MKDCQIGISIGKLLSGKMIDSFSHGQIGSKLWLCEQLEPHIKNNATVAILGSWINVLGFMLLTRQPYKYSHIKGIDLDIEAVNTANQICNYWYINGIQHSIQDNANTVSLQGFDVVINCSSEHMEGSAWFDNISSGTLVCIQSSNVTDTTDPWLVKNPSHNIDEFLSKYPLREIIFSETLPITYENWGYDRYMVIGIK
jgi:hypothetical protein